MVTMENRKRIIIFSIAYFPRVGGAEVFVKEIARRLSHYEYDLICARFDRRFPCEELIGNVNVHRVGVGSIMDKFIFPIIGLLKAVQLHRKRRYHLIHGIMANYAGLAALFFKWYSGLPLLLTEQSGDSEWTVFKYTWFIHPLFKRIYKDSDHIHVISQYLNERARRYGYRGEVDVIPNGVDLKHFSNHYHEADIKKLKDELGIKDDEFVIITTSRLVLKNAVDDLIKSLPYLQIPYKLLILGTGPDEGKLRELTARLGLESSVLFLGHIDHSELPKYLKCAHVFVRPSLSEGLGNSFLEAMAAGLPVIGTPVGGIVDFLADKETGLLCPPRDPRILAEKIMVLAYDKNLRRDLIANGIKLVHEGYGWEEIANRLGQVYKRCLEKNALKITIATGIFPPDVGGPATYTEALGWGLAKEGIKVTVVCYSDITGQRDEAYPFPVQRVSRRHILPIRYLLYLLTLLRYVGKSDLIYAMGPVSDGIPAWAVSILLRKPLVIRLGGDFVWERSLELGKTSAPLRTFYQEPQDMFNRFLITVVNMVLKRAVSIVFSTDFQKGIYERDLGIPPEKGVIVENPVPFLSDNLISPRIIRDPKEILFAGRLIRKNNLEALLHAFAGIVPGHILKLRIIGEGPQEEVLRNLIEELGLGLWVALEQKLPNRDLLREVQGAYMVVLPALTDISPNFALECLRLGVPIILTRETGFYEKYQDQVIFFDPTNPAELRDKIISMLDQARYKRYSEVIQDPKFQTSWDDVVTQHLTIFSGIT